MSRVNNLLEYTSRLRQHYVPLLQRYGVTFRAVDWGSQQGQAVRFHILLEVGDFLDASILDVGCGVGHLVEYLVSKGFCGAYWGIDALREMASYARKSYPTWKFQQGDILDPEEGWTADYVLASGLFTFSNKELMQDTIKAMFRSCNRAVAFNSLSAWASSKEPGEFYADPLATLEFCRTLTPWVILRHDYMPHDFTIYMYRDAR